MYKYEEVKIWVKKAKENAAPSYLLSDYSNYIKSLNELLKAVQENKSFSAHQKYQLRRLESLYG